jgi:hypothetical protein
MPHHKYGAHGCVLRRDVDEMKNDLAEVKATQHEMMTCMQRLTIAFESLQKSVNSKSTDIVVIAGLDPKTKKCVSSVERFNLFKQIWTQLPGLKIARASSAAVVFRIKSLFVAGSATLLGVWIA